MRHVMGILLLVLLFSIAVTANAGTLTGLIVESGKNTPIAYVSVTLDRIPADGTPEYTFRTGGFGLFEQKEIPAGSYQLTLSRIAYKDLVTTVEIVDNTPTGKTFQMVRTTGDAFPVYLQVRDMTTKALLPSADITINYWPGESSNQAPDVITAKTDANGMLIQPGLKAGYYQILIARTGWQPLTYPADKRLKLDKSHSANISLKPNETTLRVTVKGIDPTRYNPSDPKSLDPVALKDVVVEIRALDYDLKRRLTPPRPAMTVGNPPSVLFDSLAPVNWEIKVKKLGYDTLTRVISPDVNGKFDDVAVTLVLQQATEIELSFDSPYADVAMLQGMEVELRGLPNTATASIVRTGTLQTDGKFLAQYLIPGRYYWRASMPRKQLLIEPKKNGTFTGNNSLSLEFSLRQGVVETTLKEKHTANIFMSPVPARVHGRIFLKSKTTGVSDQGIWINQAITDLQFVDHDVPGLLKPQYQLQTTTTDANGYFSTTVIPGRYGIKAPSLSAYAPLSANYYRTDNAGNRGALEIAGWPVAHKWPDGFKNGIRQSPYIQYSSGELTNHTLRLAKRLVNLGMQIVEENPLATNGLSPYNHLVLLEGDLVPVTLNLKARQILLGEHELTLSGSKTYKTSFVLREDTDKSPVQFVFKDVEPGTYSLTADHSVFTFPALTVTVPEFVAAGEVPTVDPGQANMHPGDAVLTKTVWKTANNSYINKWSGEFKHPKRKILTFMCVWKPSDIKPGGGEEGMKWEIRQGKVGYYETMLKGLEGRLFYEVEVVPAQESEITYYAKVKETILTTYPQPKLHEYSGWAKFALADEYTDTRLCCDPSTCIDRADNTARYFRVVLGSGTTLQQNISSANKPASLPDNYRIEVKTRAESGVVVDGVELELPGGSKVTSGTANRFVEGVTTEDILNACTSSNGTGIKIVTPEWSFGKCRFQVAQPLATSGQPLTVVMTITLKRAMVVSGKIELPDGSPANKLTFEVRDQFGRPLRTDSSDVAKGTTLSDGTFTLGNLQPQPLVYLTIRQVGFLPVQQAFAPANMALSPDVTVSIKLQAVPAPQVSAFDLDRYGLFIPGVRKSGDPAGFNPEIAKEHLTLTWSVKLTPGVVKVQQTPFAAGTGQLPQSTELSLTDEISEVWLVDSKYFETNSFVGQPMPLTPPSPLTYAATRAWLAEIAAGKRGANVFRVVSQQGSLDAGQYTGKLHLADLPVGEFRPRAIVFTRFGGVAVVDYTLPAGRHVLKGIAIPKWASFMINLLGVASTAPGLDLKQLVPENKLIPMPGFNSRISLENNYLLYDYRINVAWNEAMKGSKGILGYGGRLLGITAPAQFGFIVKGADSTVNLLGRVFKSEDLLTKTADANGLKVPGVLPADAKPRGHVKLGFEGFGEMVISQKLTQKPFPDYKISASLNAALTVNAEVDLGPVLNKLPYIGPVLFLLRRTGALAMSGTVDMALGGKVGSSFETRYPDNEFGPTQDGSTPQLTPFGGLNSLIPSWESVYWRAGMGLKIDLLAGRVSGSGKVEIGAPADKIVPFTSVVMTVNKTSNWPLITRVKGALNLVAGVTVKVWKFKLSKDWRWTVKAFDWQLSTEPTVEMVENKERLQLLSPQTATPSTWTNSNGVLVAGFFEAGTLTGQNGSLLYSQTAPDGSMPLMFSGDTPNGWSVATKIADTNGLVGSAIVDFEDGRLMAVWSETESKELQLLPKTKLMYALSTDDGNTWQPPVEIAKLGGVGHSLEIALSNGKVLLAYQLTTDGPLSAHSEIWSAIFDGQSWKNHEKRLDKSVFTAMSVAGKTATTHWTLAVLSDDGTAQALSHDGAQWGTMTTVFDSAAGDIAALYGGDTVLVALGSESGPRVFKRELLATTWIEWVKIQRKSSSSQMQFRAYEKDDSTVLLLAWVEGNKDGNDTVWATYLDSGELPGADVFAVTEGEEGKLEQVGLIALDGENFPAKIVAHAKSGNSSNVVEWQFTRSKKIVAPVVEHDNTEADVIDPTPDTTNVGPDGTATTDATTNTDGGDNKNDSGGGCTVTAPASPPTSPWMFLLLLAIAFSCLQRRRRQQRDGDALLSGFGGALTGGGPPEKPNQVHKDVRIIR